MAKKVAYKDFDAMFSEMEYETIPFKAFGRHYSIRKAIPAALVLEMAEYEDDKDIPVQLLYKATKLIFGEEVLEYWKTKPEFTIDKLGIIIQWAFTAIKGADEEEPEIEEVTEDELLVSQKPKRKN